MRTHLLSVVLLLACGDDSASGGAGAGGDPTGPGAGPATGGGGSGATGAGAAGGGTGGTGGLEPPTTPYVYVGDGDGSIRSYLLDRATGSLAPLGTVDVGQNPSFLAASPDRRFLYAVDEGASEVVAFSIDATTGSLSEIGARQSSEGNGPAYVSVDATGAWVLVANYGGGTVAVLPVLKDGSLGAAVTVESPGTNPHLIRTDASNQHVYVPCLGSDHVAEYAFDATTGALTDLGVATLPAGTGPRHLELHPTLPVVWVIGEFGDTVTTFEVDPSGRLQNPSSVSTLPDGADGASNFCADLHVDREGRFLYGSNRGHDSVALFTLDPTTGAPTPAGHTPTGGAWPRNFGLDPDGGVLLVANQQSDTIVSFAIDPTSGALTELVTTAVGASPAWVGVIPQP
jgi:6-phosphogluconolactonase